MGLEIHTNAPAPRGALRDGHEDEHTKAPMYELPVSFHDRWSTGCEITNATMMVGSIYIAEVLSMERADHKDVFMAVYKNVCEAGRFVYEGSDAILMYHGGMARRILVDVTRKPGTPYANGFAVFAPSALIIPGMVLKDDDGTDAVRLACVEYNGDTWYQHVSYDMSVEFLPHALRALTGFVTGARYFSLSTPDCLTVSIITDYVHVPPAGSVEFWLPETLSE
jgi:hypothetical protein